MHFGEYELSPSFDWPFTPNPHLIQKLFNAYWFGPPSRVTGLQPGQVDHLVSRLPPPTMRPIQTRFRFGCAHHALNLADDGNS